MKRKLVFLIVLSMVVSALYGFSGAERKEVSAAATLQKVNFTDAVVTAQLLNVRQGTSTSFPVVCVLRKGQVVKVLGRIGDWYVVYEPGTRCVGASHGAYLRPAGTAPAPAPVRTSTPRPVPKPVPTVPRAVSTLVPPQSTSVPAAGITQEEQTLLNLVNKARTDAGVRTLAFDMALVKTARLKAADMVQNNYFSHQSPTYGSPFDMMRQFGITFTTAGENIAGNQTVERAFNAWMNSEGHRKNILNPSFNYTGIGIASGSPYGKIFVQQFIGR